MAANGWVSLGLGMRRGKEFNTLKGDLKAGHDS